MRLPLLVALLVGSAAGAVIKSNGDSFMRRHFHQADASVPSMKAERPYYHTSEELRNEAVRLVQTCQQPAFMRTLTKDGVSIDVLRISGRSNATNRVFMLFGEHSRELIGPESGLHFLKYLCGEEKLDAAGPAEVLEDNEFEIVLNGNPRSRLKVEQGNYCVRENPAGVDLNRNWDEMWKESATAFSNTNPGPRPFSEPETQMFKELVTAYQPTTFLTIHSGTRGMYMPWAFDTEHLATRNQHAMMSILSKVDEKHCRCPYGAAGREVGYSCPGTCLDWVYDKMNTSFAFALEIWAHPEEEAELEDRWKEKKRSGGNMLLQQGHHLGHAHFLDFFKNHSSDFVQVRDNPHQKMLNGIPNEQCFSMFNPDTQIRYDATVKNWAEAFVEMAQQTSKALQEQPHGQTVVF